MTPLVFPVVGACSIVTWSAWPSVVWSYWLRLVTMPSAAASVSVVMMASTTTLPALTDRVMSLGCTPAPRTAARLFLYEF